MVKPVPRNSKLGKQVSKPHNIWNDLPWPFWQPGPSHSAASRGVNGPRLIWYLTPVLAWQARGSVDFVLPGKDLILMILRSIWCLQDLCDKPSQLWP